MPTSDDMNEHEKTLRETINTVLNIDREKLYGSEIANEPEFADHGKKLLEMFFSLVEDLNSCDLSIVSIVRIANIKTYLQEYLDHYNRNIDELISHTDSNFSILFNSSLPVINFAGKNKLVMRKYEKNFQESLDRLENYSDERKQEVENILATVREASANVGVSKNAIHFSEAEKEHAKKAGKWRWAIIALLLALLAFVMCMYSRYFHEKDSALVLGYLEVAILFGIILLGYAISFCSKNFFAEKHNQTVNANKARVLSTFRAFVDGTGDDRVKDQILIYAGASAFSNPSTGFNKDQGVPLPPTAEFVRGAAKKLTDKV